MSNTALIVLSFSCKNLGQDAKQNTVHQKIDNTNLKRDETNYSAMLLTQRDVDPSGQR